MSSYQVVAECAHVTLSTPMGKFVTLLYKGAMVPADAPELERLLREGYVAEVGGVENGGVDAAGIPAGAYTSEVPESITSTPVEKSEEQLAAEKAEADEAEKRAAAQAKLAEFEDGPDGRSSQAVWVEYLVSRGSRYADVASATKAELQKLAEQQS